MSSKYILSPCTTELVGWRLRAAILSQIWCARCQVDFQPPRQTLMPPRLSILLGRPQFTQAWPIITTLWSSCRKLVRSAMLRTVLSSIESSARTMYSAMVVWLLPDENFNSIWSSQGAGLGCLVFGLFLFLFLFVQCTPSVSKEKK